MLSALQLSKLNHMDNKFDLFLKDTDLNKKSLFWNKLNFTTKEVGEVRKQFFPNLFSCSAQQWHSQFQDEEVFSSLFLSESCSLWRTLFHIWRCGEHHTDRWDLQPFPGWGKAAKVIQMFVQLPAWINTNILPSEFTFPLSMLRREMSFSWAATWRIWSGES